MRDALNSPRRQGFWGGRRPPKKKPGAMARKEGEPVSEKIAQKASSSVNSRKKKRGAARQRRKERLIIFESHLFSWKGKEDFGGSSPPSSVRKEASLKRGGRIVRLGVPSSRAGVKSR